MDADRLFRLLERVGLDDEPKVAALVGAAAAHPSPVVGQRLQKLIEVKAAGQYRYPFPESERSELVNELEDQIELGVTKTGSRFTLTESDLARHVLIPGQSGSGKTTIIMNIKERISVPWWSFDLKQDYRHLVRTEMDVTVLPWQVLQLNPLCPPPGVAPIRWAQVVAEVFGHANSLLSASKNEFLSHLLDAYRDAGVLPADGTDAANTGFDVDRRGWDSVEWPTLLDVEDSMTGGGDSWKNKQYRATVSNRLRSMCSVTGDMFWCRRGVPLADLLQENVVFEFDGLMNDLQDFLMELLFAWVYEYRVAHADRGGEIQHAFFLDEAKRVFSVYKERQDAAGLPHISEVMGKARELLMPVIAADQEPIKLTDSLKANTYTTILLPMGDDTQFEAAVEGMLLSERQQRYAESLETGEGIVQQGGGDAVPVTFHPYDLAKDVTDAELKELQHDRWQTLRKDSDSSFDRGVEPDEVRQRPDTPTEDPDKGRDLSEQAALLLEDVVDHPWYNLTDHYEALELSQHAGNKAKTALLEAGLIEEHTVRKKYGRPTILGLTDDGEQRLEQRDVDVVYRGRGGPRHRYWQHFLAEKFAEVGYEATIEGDHADVAVTADGGRVAVEIAMTARDREIEHVVDRFDSGFGAVVIGCPTERVLLRLRRKLGAAELLEDARVDSRLLRELQTDFEDAV